MNELKHMAVGDKLAEKVANYAPDNRRLASLRDVPIVLLSAMSGTGKNAIIDCLLARHPNEYRFLLSHTTRAPRSNDGVMERDGVNYHFINFEQAERLLDNREYVEANWYAGNIYGLTVNEILAAHEEGKIAINEIEVQGANDFAERVPAARAIFVLPPNYEEWQRRLKNRYGDKQEQYAEDLHRRNQTAKLELENALAHDHFYLIVNDVVDRAAEAVHEIACGQQPVRRSPVALAVAQELLLRLNEIS
jgi:guanylate kinase